MEHEGNPARGVVIGLAIMVPCWALAVWLYVR